MLNISDRIKVINVEPFPEDVRIGDIATVENFGRWEESYILRFVNGLRVEIPSENVHKYVRKLRIPKPKFEEIVNYEVGEKVVFMENVMTCPDLCKGEIGIVIEIDDDKDEVVIDFGQNKIHNIDKYSSIIMKLEDLK